MESFKQYTEKHRNVVFSTINRYIPRIRPLAFDRILRDYPRRQGNYRRPSLLLLTNEVFGGEAEEALLPAAAIQLSEDWILIEDDIEDHSEVRRGKPTLHRLYGVENAINASHFLHATVWKMLGDYLISRKTEEAQHVYSIFYDLFIELRKAQYEECKFTYTTHSFERASDELYFRIVDSKTCYYSVYGPMQLGAVTAKRTDLLNLLKQIGLNAGRAFQISDDSLDIIGDEAKFGKQKYGDLYEGKLSLIMLHTYRNSSQFERSVVNSIYRKTREEKTKEDIAELVSLIEKYQSIEYAQTVGRDFMNKALGILEANVSRFPKTDLTETFRSAVRELYIRSR